MTIAIHTFEEFERVARQKMRRPSKYRRIKFDEIDQPGPEYEFIIDGFLTVGEKSIIGGPSMSGKSFLALHAGMSIALATYFPEWTFFGQKILKPGLVVYQAGEGAIGIRKRLRAFRRHFSIPQDRNTPFVLIQSPVDLYSPEGDTSSFIEEIKDICEDYPDLPLAAVFIDTLATATGGADENSGKDMSVVMKNIDQIRSATGANVALVHHLNKAGTNLRGHSSILANIDQVIMVQKNENTGVRTVSLGKQKDDDDNLKIQFELMATETGRYRKLDGKAETSCVCLPVGEKEVAQKQEAAKGFLLRAQEEVIFRAFWQARKYKGVVASAEQVELLRLKPDTVLVHYNDWRDEYAKVAAPDAEGNPPSKDAIKKMFDRHHKGLVTYNVLKLSNPYMWWEGKHIRNFPETRSKELEENWGGENSELPELAADSADDLPF